MQIEREGTRDHPISSLLRMVKVKLHVVIGLDLSHPPSTKRDDARQFMKFLLSDLGIGNLRGDLAGMYRVRQFHGQTYEFVFIHDLAIVHIMRVLNFFLMERALSQFTPTH
ncbi:unnamed protein product [Brassica rapa subsp. narinosa]